MTFFFIAPTTTIALAAVIGRRSRRRAMPLAVLVKSEIVHTLNSDAFAEAPSA
ncbi:hypothetical protein [Sphingomonas faeni]|uniref:hypothetical protein n=1 Tax=Sphingomonas faeni TaxID=185950 RepID=UPI0020BEFA5B|nr:hypothetical protein [Sphingomonas faeni]MCK8458375.1 hypothetical protein [Sphingomonas faeni]